MNYGFVYETICLINGKRYIGQHKRTQNINDPDDSWYLGSSNYLKRAVNKYGEENFIRIILKECNSPKELDEAERYYLKLYNCSENAAYYNVESEPWRSNYSHSEEVKKKLSESAKSRGMPKETLWKAWKTTEERVQSKEERELRSKSLCNYWSSPEGEIRKLQQSESMKGNTFREGTIQPNSFKEKMSEIMSQKVYVTNGNEQLCISESDLESYLSQGWVRGKSDEFRKMRSEDVKGKIHINKDGVDKFIYPEELDIYLQNGWSKGLSKSHRDNISKAKLGENNPMYGKKHSEETKKKQGNYSRGRIWVTNGINKYFIKQEELDNYISNGYWKGMK